MKNCCQPYITKLALLNTYFNPSSIKEHSRANRHLRKQKCAKATVCKTCRNRSTNATRSEKSSISVCTDCRNALDMEQAQYWWIVLSCSSLHKIMRSCTCYRCYIKIKVWTTLKKTKVREATVWKTHRNRSTNVARSEKFSMTMCTDFRHALDMAQTQYWWTVLCLFNLV